MNYFVYILQSEWDGSYYIGHTNNLEERVSRHNRGRSQYTKAKIPWKLIYREVLNSKIGKVVPSSPVALAGFELLCFS
jgi:putative endonuclease